MSRCGLIKTRHILSGLLLVFLLAFLVPLIIGPCAKLKLPISKKGGLPVVADSQVSDDGVNLRGSTRTAKTCLDKAPVIVEMQNRHRKSLVAFR